MRPMASPVGELAEHVSQHLSDTDLYFATKGGSQVQRLSTGTIEDLERDAGLASRSWRIATRSTVINSKLGSRLDIRRDRTMGGK